MISKDKPVHIAFVCSSLNFAGGLERIVVQLANALSEHKYLISLLIISDNEKSFYPINNNIQVKSLCIEFGITEKHGYIAKKFSFINDILKFRRTVNAIKPDILITTEYQFTVAAVIARFFKKYKIVSWQHSSFFQKKSKLWQLFTGVAYKMVHYIIALNKQEETFYRKFNPNTVTIPNFTFPASAISDQNSNTILTIGRLTVNKGIDLLMHVAESVLKRHTEWKWKIIGEGELKEQLIQFIDEHQLKVNLILQPPVSSDIEEEYTNSAIYTMTSRGESFGMVLIEAMKHGVPCIAFDCETGPRHIISNNIDGILVEKENPVKLAEAISLLIENEVLRKKMGKAAKENVARFYNESVLKQWEDLFRKLMYK